MVEVVRKHSSAVFTSKSPTQDVSEAVPRRELRKRKSVHFEQPPQHKNTPSTCDFVSEENHPWDYVANCFDLCDDSKLGDNHEELIHLCNYFETQGNQRKLSDDSEENLPYDVFAEQGQRMKYPAPPASLVPVVALSTLRLSSVLRIGSPPSSKPHSYNTQSELSQKEQHDEIERAFQGVLPCSNSQKTNRRKSIEVEPNNAAKSRKEEEDFWSNVEF